VTNNGAAQLSAFAAAKARTINTSSDDAEDSDLDSEVEGDTLSKRGYLDVGLGLAEEEVDNVDLTNRSTEEAHFRNVKLSTWDPCHKNQSRLSCTEDSMNIELQPGENLAIIGLYDILVKFGAVSIYGATLRASTRMYRVYAPASHALPVVECSPVGKAQIKIRVAKNDLRDLVRLSPLFKRLWNKDKDVREEIKFLSKRSCQFVSTIFIWAHSLTETSIIASHCCR